MRVSPDNRDGFDWAPASYFKRNGTAAPEHRSASKRPEAMAERIRRSRKAATGPRESLLSRVCPSPAVERILPQLARLNWGVEALWTMRTHANAETFQLDDVQAAIREVLDRHPHGHFKDLEMELAALLARIEPQLRQLQLKQLLGRANRALEDEEDASAAYSSGSWLSTAESPTWPLSCQNCG